MFKDFNKTGHRMLAAEVVAELEDLAERHGLKFEVDGGKFGENSLTLALVAKSLDTSAADAAARRMIDNCGARLGLVGSDFGVVFTSRGKRYKFTGIAPTRPKYPLEGVCVSTERKFKFSASAAAAIIAARPKAPSPAQAAISPPANRAPEALDPRFANMAQF